MKNNIKINKPEPVEVMALFNYSQTPCQPLSFKKRAGREVEVTELLHSSVKFAGDCCEHVFDVLAGREHHRLEFNSRSLAWSLTL